MGEAMDKFTILSIKLDKIKDERRDDVKREYDVLHEKLQNYLPKCEYWMDQLKRVNLSIWEDQEKIRNMTTGENYGFLCEKIIKDNDDRFRIKRKINILFNSALREQKSYDPQIVVILCDREFMDPDRIGKVRHLSIKFDQIYLQVTPNSKEGVMRAFRDDPTIEYFDDFEKIESQLTKYQIFDFRGQII